MSLFGKIAAARTVASTMTPGGIVLAVLRVAWPYLLAIALTLLAVWWIYHRGRMASDREHAQERAELVVERDLANSQRDAALTANGSLAKSELALRNALAEATAENTRLDGQRSAALAVAERARLEAAARRGQWQARNAGTLQAPTCKAALAAMARACPVKEF